MLGYHPCIVSSWSRREIPVCTQFLHRLGIVGTSLVSRKSGTVRPSSRASIFRYSLGVPLPVHRLATAFNPSYVLRPLKADCGSQPKTDLHWWRADARSAPCPKCSFADRAKFCRLASGHQFRPDALWGLASHGATPFVPDGRQSHGIRAESLRPRHDRTDATDRPMQQGRYENVSSECIELA
jgi:hypothetical protein